MIHRVLGPGECNVLWITETTKDAAGEIGRSGSRYGARWRMRCIRIEVDGEVMVALREFG